MAKEIKHILILSSWYPNRNTPFLGNFVQRQAELLAKEYKVTVLHTVPDSNISTFDWAIHENGDLKEIILYHPKGSNFFSRRKEQDKAFEAGLDKIKDVDLIHAHVLLPKGYLFVRAKKKFACPLVLTEHGSYYRKNKVKKWSLKEKFILKFTKKQINCLIAVSDFLKEDLLPHFDQEIKVIPNPINTELFIPVEKKLTDFKRFLHISTLDKEVKNVEGIIDAIALLKAKGYTDFELLIVSDEPFASLKTYAESKNVGNLVRFEGACQPEEIAKRFQQSDAFVLFSSYESFSIVLAESWACGIPTITTPVGVGQNLPSELGIQIKIDDTLSLAMAMEKILNGLIFDSEAIRKHALQYSEIRVIHKLKELYEHINE